MSGNGAAGSAGTSSDPRLNQNASDSAAQQLSGLAGLLQSARNSINRNMEPFSEGLHKVVGGSTEQDAGYESGSEASISEVRPTVVEAKVLQSLPH